MFFTGCKSTEEVKREYYNLAKQYHPDVNPTTDTTAVMQEINAAYAAAMHSLKMGERPGEDAGFYAYYDGVAQNVKKAIDAILKFRGIDVEICGDWVWVSGETKPIREGLKKAGYKFAAKKVKWYFAGRPSHNRGPQFTMEQIRQVHGSEYVKRRQDDPELCPLAA